MKHQLALIIGSLALCAASCAGETCEDFAGTAPAAPTITSEASARIDVIPEAIVLHGSPFDDADPADTHAASEWEIWRMAGDTPVERVWSAIISEPTDPSALTTARLSDGSFEGLSQGVGLFAWTDYAARVRYQDSSKTCEQWSQWSPELRFRTDDGSSLLFDPESIHDIYIDIPQDSWDRIDAEALPPECVPHERSYHPVTVRFGDLVYPGAGGRVKGGCGSARRLGQKAGFKLNLSWDDPAVPGCPDNRRLHGEKRITLNNAVQDHTFLHEQLGYRFYQAMGVPTPRTAFIQVHVNDELWGLYINQESIDRRFLERWFASHRGMMYEGTYWCDLVPENVPASDDRATCLSAKFEAGECDSPEPGDDPMGYGLLAELVADIAALPEGGFYPEVERFFAFDTFLSQWAVESIIAHWDAYEFSIINNYRVYHDPGTDRWTIIPTGIDQTFSGEIDPFGVSGILARRCVDEPDCREAFERRLATAVDVFEQMDLGALALRTAERITPYVMADPKKEFDGRQHGALVDELVRWIEDRPGRVRAILGN